MIEGPVSGANLDVYNALYSVSQDMIATGEAILPIALSVVGIALVVMFGVRLFKKIAK